MSNFGIRDPTKCFFFQVFGMLIKKQKKINIKKWIIYQL